MGCSLAMSEAVYIILEGKKQLRYARNDVPKERAVVIYDEYM